MFLCLYGDVARVLAKLPFSLFSMCLLKMSQWILNIWTDLMMAGTPSMMALIIQPSAAESWRPPQGWRRLPLNLLTPISLHVFVCSPPLQPALPKDNFFLLNTHHLFVSVGLLSTLIAHCMIIYSKIYSDSRMTVIVLLLHLVRCQDLTKSSSVKQL